MLKSYDTRLNLYVYAFDFDEAFRTAMNGKLTGISIANDLISFEQVQTARSNSIKITIWDVHSEEENETATNKNPDFIQTDDIRSMIKIKNNNSISKIRLY